MGNNSLKPLSRSTDFQDLRKNGKKARLESWLLFVFKPNGLNDLRVGFSISSRYLNSVKRNRLKRVFREILRKKVKPSQGWDIHLIVTRKVTAPEWGEFDQTSFQNYSTKMAEKLH